MHGMELGIANFNAVRQLERLVLTGLSGINVGPHHPILRLNGVVTFEVARDVGRRGEYQLVTTRLLTKITHAPFVGFVPVRGVDKVFQAYGGEERLLLVRRLGQP